MADKKTTAKFASEPTAEKPKFKFPSFLDNMFHVVIATLIVGALIGAGLTFAFIPQEAASGGAGVCEAGLSTDLLTTKTLAFINDNMLSEGFSATDGTATAFNGAFQQIDFTLSSTEGDEAISVLVTNDGKTMLVPQYGEIIFPTAYNAFDLDLALPEQDPVTEPEPTPEQPGTAEASADDDPFLGPEDAKVTVIEFSDYECPYCAATVGEHDVLIARFRESNPDWMPAVPRLKELAAEGKIKFVFRDYPLGGHSKAQKAAEATECADEQGKFWEMHDMLFENQTALDVTNLKQYASDLGLDTAAFNECLDSGAMAAEVQADFAAGNAVGVTGTPAYFINGVKVSGAQPASVFEQIIEQELAK